MEIRNIGGIGINPNDVLFYLALFSPDAIKRKVHSAFSSETVAFNVFAATYIKSNLISGAGKTLHGTRVNIYITRSRSRQWIFDMCSVRILTDTVQWVCIKHAKAIDRVLDEVKLTLLCHRGILAEDVWWLGFICSEESRDGAVMWLWWPSQRLFTLLRLRWNRYTVYI